MMQKKEATIAVACIIAIALAVRAYFLFDFHELWWDSAVYVAMAKYLFSLGHSGFWEPIRPVVWPIMLGFAWAANLDVLLYGKVLQIVLSAGVLYLTYKVSAIVFDRTTGVFAAAIFSASSIFLYSVFHLYTEIPALFFIMLSVYLLVRGKVFLSGVFLAVAVLTKFTMLIFAPALLVVFDVRTWLSSFRSSTILFLGFFAGLSPFLAANLIAYRSALFPFVHAHKVILDVVGCNVLWYKPWYHYFQLFWQENPLYLVIPFSLVFLVDKYRPKRLIVASCFLFPFFYFLILHCKDYRYMLTFLPFAAMLVACFISAQLSKLPKWVLYLFLFTIIALSMPRAILYYQDHEPVSASYVREGYYHFLGENISGEVWVSNPAISVYSDERLFPLYYPVFSEYHVINFYQYLYFGEDRISHVFLDTCGGGIICHPNDIVCKKGLRDILQLLHDHYELVYNETEADCRYLVFRSS
ncbi:MAG: glycosyltransferase family 39 protein [Candidatus Woesearchaeota archaeon]